MADHPTQDELDLNRWRREGRERMAWKIIDEARDSTTGTKVTVDFECLMRSIETLLQAAGE